MTATPIVQAERIVRRDALRDNRTLLQPTDFALVGGDRVAISGPSGSGKSVLLRALALLDPLDGGRVRWHGNPVSRSAMPRYRRAIAYIRQRPALLDGTVEDNLRYPFSLAVYRDVRFEPAYVEALATHAGRGAGFLERQASELSGGEAQIVALIRVLQLAPEVLLLDEPTASLDPESTDATEALIDAWFEDAPAARACVWVSHDRAQAARVGRRQLTMRAGVLSEPAADAPDPVAAALTRKPESNQTIGKESTR
ncbi:ABC transporter ATP-binding protein [Paraburkholderia rhizosphaerae]|nr:ATP-binding cassette domain-containing protein [Paraburkholderia rhizosphaerae]